MEGLKRASISTVAEQTSEGERSTEGNSRAVTAGFGPIRDQPSSALCGKWCRDFGPYTESSLGAAWRNLQLWFCINLGEGLSCTQGTGLQGSDFDSFLSFCPWAWSLWASKSAALPSPYLQRAKAAGCTSISSNISKQIPSGIVFSKWIHAVRTDLENILCANNPQTLLF